MDPRLVQLDPPRRRTSRFATHRAMPIRLAYRYLARSIDSTQVFSTSDGYDHVIRSHPPLVGVQGEGLDNNKHGTGGKARWCCFKRILLSKKHGKQEKVPTTGLVEHLHASTARRTIATMPAYIEACEDQVCMHVDTNRLLNHPAG